MEQVNVIDQITITEHNVVLVRTSERAIKDGEVFAENYIRKSFTPGQNITGEDARVQAVCAAVWTPAAVSAYQQLVNNQD
jgi:hypothetical protein